MCTNKPLGMGMGMGMAVDVEWRCCGGQNTAGQAHDAVPQTKHVQQLMREILYGEDKVLPCHPAACLPAKLLPGRLPIATGQRCKHKFVVVTSTVAQMHCTVHTRRPSSPCEGTITTLVLSSPLFPMLFGACDHHQQGATSGLAG